MKNALIEQAMRVTTKKERVFTKEEMGLALEWFKGNLKTKQVAAVLDKSESNTPYYLIAYLKQALKEGLIIVKE